MNKNIQTKILEIKSKEIFKILSNIKIELVGKDYWFDLTKYQSGLEKLFSDSIKEVENKTRKETIDKYFLDAGKRLSITQKENKI